MKKIVTLSLIAASALSVAAGAAQAQSYGPNRGPDRGYDQGHWTSINQRQAMLDRRIDQGIRSGDLNRREAVRLRTEFRQIARMEARYRQNGLSNWERADLDRRFDRLSMRIRGERHDNQYGQGYGYGRDYRR
jgi:hypothetical protein